jgi:hypothetical protein
MGLRHGTEQAGDCNRLGEYLDDTLRQGTNHRMLPSP